MKLARLAVLGLLVVARGFAFAADEPEVVYDRLHRTIFGPFNPPAIFPFLSSALRDQFAKDTQQELRFINKIQFMKDEMPRVYKVTGKTPKPDGRSVRLQTAGEGKDFFGKPAQLTGTVDLVNERGEWKIVELTWGKRKAP